MQRNVHSSKIEPFMLTDLEDTFAQTMTLSASILFCQ